MTNEELHTLRKLLNKYTEFQFSSKDFSEFNPLERINFLDRANRVVFDVEIQIKATKKQELLDN